MERRGTVTRPKRGEVYLVNFDPTVGAEIKKTRPALVIQNDIGNRYSPIIIVAAITSSFDDTLYPTEVLIAPPEGGVLVPSIAALNQIRSVDIRRLTQRLGALKPETMERVDRALKISVGLLEI
jgi:mRNA interferase MazF